MKKLIYISTILISLSVSAQHGINKGHISKAYNELRQSAYYPDTWSLVDYSVYADKRDRKCIDIVIIEIKAKNAYGVPFSKSFLCFLIRGRMFWYMETEYKPSFISFIKEEGANELIETAVKTSLDIERTITKEELCKTNSEIQEDEEKEKKEAERISLEKKQKDEDGLILKKIDSYLANNLIEDAAIEFDRLTFEYTELQKNIQNRLVQKYENEVVSLNDNTILDYIQWQKRVRNTQISQLSPGEYEIVFNRFGLPSNEKFPRLWQAFSDVKIPSKKFGDFEINISSKAIFKIELKDSILISNTYSTSNEKALFIDKNENFYFKTKTGLPVATTSNNPSIDKKLVRINKVYKREKYANGILIDSQEFKTEKTVGIQKKDQ
jgi:hypothetical protein